jgi:peptide/nickel transport system ATP-binding protein
MSTNPLLKVQDLQVHFDTDDGVLHAVDGVNFHIDRSETLGVVGESGCGKSVTAMTIMKLLAIPPGRIANGQIWFQGQDLVQADAQTMRNLRAKEIAMKQAMAKASDMLGLVNIPKPAQRINDYPHQFSGGMRQRVMIAMALSCKPKLLIADEPTTALDVTIQAQILDLLNELKSQMGMSIMLITHAMGVVAETAQRVVVMYAGRVVEEASVEKLFASPAHPYTKGLIRSIPRIDFDSDHKQRLEAIPGSVPKLINPPMGCRFAPRCQYASDRCTQEMPELREISTGHSVACHFSL